MATAAAPVLASSIWETLEKAKEKEDERPKPISLGVKSVDNALGGGLEYGAVHAITAEPDQAVREVVQAILVSHLLSSPRATATVIDSSLSFDVRRLFAALQASLGAGEDAKQKALNALDRLKIMKVFDHVGLTEAVAEMRESLENRLIPEEGKKLPKSTIEDSEDEEELALDTPSPPKAPPPPDESDQSGANLLIIDSISQVMAPLIKNNYPQGQALLSTFMRSVSHLTREHNICTLVLGSPSNKPAGEDETLSIFKSCTIRSALGVGLGYLVDVHMYLHSLPMRKPEKTGQRVKGAEMANVLEVVQDLRGCRYGRWAAFVCGADGRLEEVPES